MDNPMTITAPRTNPRPSFLANFAPVDVIRVWRFIDSQAPFDKFFEINGAELFACLDVFDDQLI